MRVVSLASSKRASSGSMPEGLKDLTSAASRAAGGRGSSVLISGSSMGK